jgi:asparagine synthase (glutamine-hydrolysing)
MCGIYASNCLGCKDPKIITRMKQNQRHLRHRGPDCYYTKEAGNVFMAHHRLAIIDTSSEANQPFVNEQSRTYLTVNGEIYNYKELYNTINDEVEYKQKSDSDCEVILALYEKILHQKEESDALDTHQLISGTLLYLDGMFSFALYDDNCKRLLVARDPYGITSLYYGFDKEGYLHISSELKTFHGNKIRPQMFPAGHFIYYDVIGGGVPEFHKYYKSLDLLQEEIITRGLPHNVVDYNIDEEYISMMSNQVNKTLTEAVFKRLQSNVPFTMLLSGGLDSSLVCSIACKILRGELPEYPISKLKANNIRVGEEINTFSIGFKGSPDLDAAQKVADYLGTKHHSIIITIDEALLAIRDVIWHLETYDVTTIRASTPMYLLARKIKALGYKMVLSGEGSDEVLGGYLYFLNAPSNDDHSAECIRRVEQLQYFDNLRANKSTMAWGLEARVPFLDTAFVELGLSQIPAELKRKDGIEKWILRNAFNKSEYQQYDYLPQELLWRQKEQFSDGVGYQWIDTLRQIAEDNVSEFMMKVAGSEAYYPVNTPRTKEEYYYRTIFESIYPDKGFEYCVKKWIPNMKWGGVGYDPSGRAQKSHQASDGFKE